MAGVCGSVPVYGGFVGRAISPAAGPCCGAGFAGRCKHRPLRSIGQGPAGLCRTFLPPGGNAPLRLRLAAHPPSGLRCPHRAACAEAYLRSATVKPAPSRFLRRRRRSTPQPLAGEALGGPPPGRLPCKGSCRRQPTEGCGALPCQYPSGPPRGLAASQGLRDDASIGPYEASGEALPGLEDVCAGGRGRASGPPEKPAAPRGARCGWTKSVCAGATRQIHRGGRRGFCRAYASPAFSLMALSMALAASLPAPMARMTVAAPVTASPPA